MRRQILARSVDEAGAGFADDQGRDGPDLVGAGVLPVGLDSAEGGGIVENLGKGRRFKAEVPGDAQHRARIGNVSRLAKMGALEAVEHVPVGGLSAKPLGGLAPKRCGQPVRVVERRGPHGIDIDALRLVAVL